MCRSIPILYPKIVLISAVKAGMSPRSAGAGSATACVAPVARGSSADAVLSTDHGHAQRSGAARGGGRSHPAPTRQQTSQRVQNAVQTPSRVCAHSPGSTAFGGHDCRAPCHGWGAEHPPAQNTAPGAGGDKAHRTEIGDDDSPHVIPPVATTAAPLSDRAAVAHVHAALQHHGLCPGGLCGRGSSRQTPAGRCY
jgi:hypothetical protein